MRFMGNLLVPTRWPYITTLIGSLALSGIPLFAAFFSKAEILAEAFNRGYIVFWVIGLIVAFMTAVYTFRMIFMTFWGPCRGARHNWRHIHESATTMVAPLVILAIPTIFAGLALGLPPEDGAIRHWLERVFHEAEEAGAGALPGSIVAEALSHGEHHEFQLIGVGGTLLLLGAVTGIAGVGLAYRWYVRRPGSAERFVSRVPFGLGPGMYRASVNRY